MQNEIQEGGLNQILARRLAIDSRPPSPVLATDVFPTLCLESDRPEWRFLAGERIAWASLNDAAVAGQFSSCGIYNPAGSGVLAVVQEVRGTTDNGNWLRLKITARTGALFDTTGSVRARDSRWRFGDATLGYFQRTQVADPLSSVQDWWGYANMGGTPADVVFTLPIVLAPDSVLWISSDSNNDGITAAAVWRERRIEQGETG